MTELTTDQQRDWFLKEITAEIARFPEQEEDGDYNAGFVKGCIDGYVRAASAFGLLDREMIGDYVAAQLDDVPHDLDRLLGRQTEDDE